MWASTPTTRNGKSTRTRRKTAIKRVLSAGRCRHRPLRGEKRNTLRFIMALCRGGRLCPPSKSGDFPWLFVGADAHLGAKSRALRGCASKLACGRRIGPLKCCEFALVFHKTEQFRRADRVVRPYGVEWKTNADSPENRHKTGVSCGSMWASIPTARNGEMRRFSHDLYDF